MNAIRDGGQQSSGGRILIKSLSLSHTHTQHVMKPLEPISLFTPCDSSCCPCETKKRGERIKKRGDNATQRGQKQRQRDDIRSLINKGR